MIEKDKERQDSTEIISEFKNSVEENNKMIGKMYDIKEDNLNQIEKIDLNKIIPEIAKYFFIAVTIFIVLYYAINPWIQNDFTLHTKELELNEKKIGLEMNIKSDEIKLRSEENKLNFTIQALKMASSSGLVQKLFPSQKDLVSLLKGISIQASYKRNDSSNETKYDFGVGL
jgi:flagellar biosynthesis protein FlhB